LSGIFDFWQNSFKNQSRWRIMTNDFSEFLQIFLTEIQ
jgi:hypothetical protein